MMPVKLKNKIHRGNKFFFGFSKEDDKKFLASFAKDKKTIIAVRPIITDGLRPTLIRK